MVNEALWLDQTWWIVVIQNLNFQFQICRCHLVTCNGCTERGVGIALSMLIVRTRGALVFNATPPPLYPRKRAPVPMVHDPRWAVGSVWTGVEKGKSLASTGVQTP